MNEPKMYTWKEAVGFLGDAPNIDENGNVCSEFQSVRYLRNDRGVFGVNVYKTSTGVLYCWAIPSDPTFGCYLSPEMPEGETLED